MIAPGYGLIAALDLCRGETVRQILSSQGLDTFFTRDGKEARAALRGRGTPALVVTDLCLPGSDGFALLRELRGFASAHEAPAIVMSSFADLRAAADNLRGELGIVAVLPARASTEKVSRAIKRALDREHAAVGLLVDEGSCEPAFSLTPAAVSPLASLRWRSHDEGLAAIAQETSRTLGVPVVFVALALGDRIVVPARVGVHDAPEARLLLDQVSAAHDLLIVPEVTRHPLFARARPLAALAGYAAAPITSAHGEVLGALCIADEKPLALGAGELDELQLFARRLAGELELRADRAIPASVAGETPSALSAILDHLDTGVAVVSSTLTVTFASAALAEMVDVPARRLVGMSREAFVDALAQLGPDASETRRKLRVGAGLYSGREEIEVVRPRRRVLRWTARPFREDGQVAQLEVFADITAETELSRERESLARTDWLTGLVNRRGGAEAIAREVARARRLGSSLCFALFDIDEFKRVNDVHGHPTGDDVLKEVSRVLLGALRGSDLAVRWGGDELLVLLPAVPESGARVFAERVRKRIAALEAHGLPRVTVSCGVAELERFEDVAAAIKRADARLYEAKAEGRNRVK